MDERTYLKLMVSLGEDLERAASAEPYDPDQYNKVIDSINKANRLWFRSRRHYSCWTRWIIFVLILLLAWTVYSILF